MSDQGVEIVEEPGAGAIPEGCEEFSQEYAIELAKPRTRHIRPKIEEAIKLYTLGQLPDKQTAARFAGVNANWFSILFNSPEGQAIVNSTRQQLEFQYQALYKKFVKVVGEALDHPDPAVALAGANLFAKTSVGTKTTVNLTAEDVVQSILNGSYQEP